MKLIIAFVLVSATCFGQRTLPDVYDFSTVQHKIQSWIDSGYYTGASFALYRGKQQLYRHYFGDHREGKTVYIASAGKWLAAATIAAVVDKGLLSWDDPVSKWLPSIQGGKANATLRQLLSHTAGYPDYQPSGKHRDDYQTLKEAVDSIAGLPADTTPGAIFHYGGLAMQVAGRMAELATGKNWETLFQELIANPLQMRNTHFTPVDSTAGHNPMVGGGARSTLEDYCHFLQMIAGEGMFENDRILSLAAIREMQADQINDAAIPAEWQQNFVKAVSASDHKGIYGLGQWREEVDAHGNALLISSPSWAGAYPWIDKVNGVYGFLLARVANQKKGFSPFLSSPVIPLLVCDALKDAAQPAVKRGYAPMKGGRLYYEELGKGTPVIFIHGHSFDHSEWDPQFYAMAARYRVIRYDVRGYGRSSMPEEGSAGLHAEDLLALMNYLKISRAHLVGLSMGGFITTDFLAMHQEHVLTATLASGDIYGAPGPSTPWSDSLVLVRKQQIHKLMEAGIFTAKQQWFNALTTRNGKTIPSLRKPVWEMIYKWDAWQLTHVEPRYLLGKDIIHRLQQTKITVPVMVLTGSFDAGKRRQILDLIPGAKEVIVKDAGHVSNIENPQAFTQAVEAFIETSSTPQYRK